MRTLYILGNGVDIGLGLPTRYTDFRKWLETNNACDYQKIYVFFR